MSISIIPLGRAEVALKVDGAWVDISAGVRVARLAVSGEATAYFTLESAWAQQMEHGRRGALLLTVLADSATDSAYAHLRDWLAAGGSRELRFTQNGSVVTSGTFRLLALLPLVDALAGGGTAAEATARLVLDGVLSVG
jgi:hypothetical protein